jgi:site-specific DNA recombinase
MSLRFAGLVRVSTEKQAEKGESLNTQASQIDGYVASMKGDPKIRWYKGQEHATPDYERKILDKLLADSGKGLFDAVIVCDASRWSRDNKQSKEGLEVLRKNEIRFYIGTTEHDLFSPQHRLILGMSAEFGEFQAAEQGRKSIWNRINRAKRNIPTSGKLPFGRAYDVKTGVWGIDEEKARKIKQAADRYLKGESVESIAATFSMNTSNLWKILTKTSGDKWPLNFRSKASNVDETVVLTIPRLLDDKIILAILKKADLNRTFKRGFGKNKYLLSHRVLCAECGYAMTGNPNKWGKRYYRHPPKNRRQKRCSQNRAIPADLLENSVLIHLIKTFGDVEALRKAVDQATPNREKVEQLRAEQSQLKADLAKIGQQKGRIIDSIADGIISKEESKLKLDKLREKETRLQERLDSVDAELSSVPDKAKSEKLVRWIAKMMPNLTREDPARIFKKSYEWKSKLIEHAFTGFDAQGNRLGVYVKRTANPDQPWEMAIRGMVENTLLGLPLDDTYLEDVFNLDPESQDIGQEMKVIRSRVANSASY